MEKHDKPSVTLGCVPWRVGWINVYKVTNGWALRAEETQQRAVATKCGRWEGISGQSVPDGMRIKQLQEWNRTHATRGLLKYHPQKSTDRVPASSIHPNSLYYQGHGCPLSGLGLLICGLDDLQGPRPLFWVLHLSDCSVLLYASDHY